MTESPTPKSGILVEDDGHQPRLNEVAKKFIDDCAAEKERLGDEFPLAAMLIDEAIDRVHSTGRIPGREMYADVFKQKLIKISQKVFVPIKQFPNFNFNGKLLGPKGKSLRSLQEETLCRVLIKGRNSMRDSAKEEELRQSGDPRHAHLNKDLFYEIQSIAPPAEAHARVAYALAEIRKYIVPDSNDEVSQSQRKEILSDPELSKKAAKYGERSVGKQQFGGNAFNRPGVSIFKKLSGVADQSQDEGPEAQEEGNNQTYRQHRMNNAGNGFQRESKPIRSILKKSTDEEEEYADSPMRQNVSQRQPIKRPNPGGYAEKQSFGGPSKTSKFFAK